MSRLLHTCFQSKTSNVFLLFISISLISLNISYSQVNWDKVYGGATYDEAKVIIPAHDGGYLIGGTSESAAGLEKTSQNKNGQDYWIVKIDTGGVKQWDKSFSGSAGNGTGDDNLTALIPTSDGGYLLGGSSVSELGIDKSDTHDGEQDFWVIKIDVLGNKVWDKNIGGNSDDLLYSMVETPDGGFLLGGYSKENPDVEEMFDKSEIGRGLKDYWLVKLDANGNKQWDKLYGGTSDDKLEEIVLTQDGNYLIGGSSGSGIEFEKSSNAYSLQDFWIIKIDQSGNKIWDKTIGGNNFDELKTIVATNDGGFVIGGSSYAGIGFDKSDNNRGIDDYWIVKTDAAGNKQWDKTFGSEEKDVITDIQINSNNELLLIGASESPAGYEKSENSAGSYDYWIIKTDMKGKFIGEITIGGVGTDFAQSGVLNTNDELIVVGASSSPITADIKSNASLGDMDFWLINMEVPLVINHEIDINDWVLVCKFCNIWRNPLDEVTDFEYRFWPVESVLEDAVYRIAFSGRHRDEAYWLNETDFRINFYPDLGPGEYFLQMRAIFADKTVSDWSEPSLINVEGDIVKAYPNPVKDWMHIEYESRVDERVQVLIKSYMGRKIFEGTFTAVKGHNQWRLQIPDTEEKLLIFYMYSAKNEPYIQEIMKE